MIKVCFVCTGNTCRSVMAERLLKKQLKQKKITDVKVFSKGLKANGDNIADNAKKALKRLGASAANRKSVQLKKVDKDMLYIVMNEGMKGYIASPKVISMKSLIGQDIPDPYGQDENVYYDTAKILKSANEKLIELIVNWRNK